MRSSQSSFSARGAALEAFGRRKKEKAISESIERERHLLDIPIVQAVGVGPPFRGPLPQMVRAFPEAVREDLRLAARAIVDSAEHRRLFPSSRPRSQELEIRALDVAVIELSPSVGFLTCDLLEVPARGENEEGPGGKLPKDAGERAIERPDFFFLAAPPGVGWVRDEASVLALARNVGRVPARESNVAQNRRFRRASAGEVEDPLVAVACIEWFSERGPRAVARLFTGARPKIGRESRPGLRGEGSLPARREISPDESRLDGESSRPAERVEEGKVAVPMAQEHQPRRERFLERRSTGLEAVAALVESRGPWCRGRASPRLSGERPRPRNAGPSSERL